MATAIDEFAAAISPNQLPDTELWDNGEEVLEELLRMGPDSALDRLGEISEETAPSSGLPFLLVALRALAANRNEYRALWGL